jgi:hypothetical protein
MFHVAEEKAVTMVPRVACVVVWWCRVAAVRPCTFQFGCLSVRTMADGAVLHVSTSTTRSSPVSFRGSLAGSCEEKKRNEGKALNAPLNGQS